MASRDRNGKIRGKIDNIVYRGYGDKQIMQSVPKRVRQTLSTKLSALEFGLAARYAKSIREVFHNVYEEYDGNMVRRLTATIAACIRTADKEVGERDLHDADLSQLKGFTFNINAPFEKLVAVSPTLEVSPNGIIRLRIPPFIPMKDIAYPPDFFRPNGSFGIYITAFDFRNARVQIVDYTSFEFADHEREPREIEWACEKLLPKDHIVFVVFCLRYFSLNWMNQRLQTTNTDFYPTIVLDAFHVTDEMVALGIADALEAPTSNWLYPIEPHSTDPVRQKIAKLKAKAAKK